MRYTNLRFTYLQTHRVMQAQAGANDLIICPMLCYINGTDSNKITVHMLELNMKSANNTYLLRCRTHGTRRWNSRPAHFFALLRSDGRWTRKRTNHTIRYDAIRSCCEL